MSEALKLVCEEWDVDQNGYAQLMEVARPCTFAIHTEAVDEEIAIGASKFGGDPDLPANFAWPVSENGPLWFTCQINLADLPANQNALPKSGLLTFFYDDADGSAGEHSQVIYQPSTEALQKTPVVPDPKYPDLHIRHFSARSLSFRAGLSLPWELPDSLSDLDDDIDDYVSFLYDFEERQAETRDFHQLLGWPQGCDDFGALSQWRLLLQLSKQPGNVYFLIEEGQLESGNFSNCRACNE